MLLDVLFSFRIRKILIKAFDIRYSTFSGHINNLYNTCFWALVQNAGMSNRDAQEKLKVIVLIFINEKVQI